MAWTRREIETYGAVIYFSYSSTTLFLKAQRISQYFASAQKDKEGNVHIDIALSDDHREYFDNYCRAAFESVGNNFIKVNKKAFVPYTYTVNVSSINVTDYGFVKDTMLSVIDEIIERALIDYVLYKWYEHLGVTELVKKFSEQFSLATISIQNSLEQFLRKVYIYVYDPTIEWTETICVQEEIYWENKTIEWSDSICVQSVDQDITIEWSDAICVQGGYDPSFQWSETICVQEDLMLKTIKWTDKICVQDNVGIKTIMWSDALCVQLSAYTPTIKWSNGLCVQVNVMQKEIKWTDKLCVQQGGVTYSIQWDDTICVQFESNTKTIKWEDTICVQALDISSET